MLIYIPIWIDLKVMLDSPFLVYADCIYIPIWIDLKVKPAVEDHIDEYNLHSNMDRFERQSV